MVDSKTNPTATTDSDAEVRPYPWQQLKGKSSPPAAVRLSNDQGIVAVELGSVAMQRSQSALLQSGSLVVLSQRVDEPVTLRLGPQAIARGQLVLVDGRIAIRITEVTGRGAITG